LGAFIDLITVGSWQGWKAVSATILLATAVLGIACDMLCLTLDKQFGYSGGAKDCVLFVGTRILGAAVGGMFGGGLLFTDRGQRLLDRLGL
jgi:hypothetical protein